MRRRKTLIAAAATLAAATAGCGVQPTGVNVYSTHAIDASTHAATTSPTPTGQYTYTLYFVRSARLVAVTRPSQTPPNESTIIDALLQGPTADEEGDKLTSWLAGQRIVPTTAQAQQYFVTPWAAQTVPQAQIVCTLAAYFKPLVAKASVGLVRLGENPNSGGVWHECADFVASMEPDTASTFSAPSASPPAVPSPHGTTTAP